MRADAGERSRIRWAVFTLLSLVVLALAAMSPQRANADDGSGQGLAPLEISPSLQQAAQQTPGRETTVIVQMRRGVGPARAERMVESAGGDVVGELPIINAVAATMPARRAAGLASDSRVRAVSANEHVDGTAFDLVDPSNLANAFDGTVAATNTWKDKGFTGKGVGVAVIDTGIAGDMPDFQVSPTDTSSRVVATAVVNPYATNAGDPYGHGTHVAGIIAGDSWNRGPGSAAAGKYIGVAPDANLIAIKAGDDQGNATVLDVIYGLQFAVDHEDDYNIRVVNLSLLSTEAQSYKTDPLDAAVEAAWFKGIAVVAAAGNLGQTAGAVNYAPANDPYVITVGGIDDNGTTGGADDRQASWSSYGRTQDGFNKPELFAPGAHVVSTLSPGSAFTQMCPSCIVDGDYIRAGGTSMAAPVVSGAAALLLQAHPDWTPDQVKGALMATGRAIGGVKNGKAIVINKALGNTTVANKGLTPNTLVSSATGDVDYSRSSWSRSSWSSASSGDPAYAGWARSSWSCTCSLDDTGGVSPTRSSWSRSSWSTDWAK